MSASLVGSEMCIRDSISTVHMAWERFPAVHRNASQYIATRRNSAHGLGPVSYTHLTLPTICSV
eukprot:5479253-Alexandrium_andersonii.AAC.1